jgi:FixJ family two-component response regulator
MNSETSPRLVAIVDDDRSVQSALKDLLESAGLSARSYGSAEEFLGSGGRGEAACLVTDVRMPGMSGLELQARLKAEGSRIPIIFITAHADAKTKSRAMAAGAIEFLSKPFDDEVLLDKVRAALGG